MSRLLLRLLARFLTLAVDGEGDPPDPQDAGGTGDEGLDELLGAVEPEGEPVSATEGEPENPLVKEARSRADAATRELEAERAARRAAEARIPVAPIAGDPEYDREEQELAQARASGATQESLSWLQWKIDSNRKIRLSERNATSALRQAEDISDRNAFERLEITKPQVFKRYKDRVEATMTEMRAKGQNAPRLAVLRLLIGDDIMNGKIKPKAAKAAAEGAPAPSTVDRGRTPGVRTDVRGRAGSLTEHEKRRARLENTPL